MDILTFASSMPDWSAFTRTLTLKSTTRFTGTMIFMFFREVGPPAARGLRSDSNECLNCTPKRLGALACRAGARRVQCLRRVRSQASSSPMIPRRKASTQMTKMMPCEIVNHAPNSDM